jgi:hypothetical protein
LTNRPGYDVKLPIQFKLLTMSTSAPPALQFVETEHTTKLVYCVNKYKLPQGYFSWQKTLSVLRPSINTALTTLNKHGENWFKKKLFRSPDSIYARCGYTACRVLCADVPPICISEKILESFLKTDVPSIETPNYPLPAFMFYLPMKASKTISNDLDVYSIFIMPSKNSGMLDAVCITDKKYILHEISCSWETNLRDEESFKDLDEETLNVANKVERIIKNAILAYTYEKKYVKDSDESETTFSKGFKDSSDKPMPFRWLGKDFIQSVSKSKAKILNDSTSKQRNKVRSHWRRGHWHTVCSGAKRKERQVRWFKPVFINGD